MSEPNHSSELAENGAEDYPDTLRITVGSVDSAFEAAIAQLGGDGSAEEAVRSFDSVADVRQLFTNRRVEFMRSIMTTTPDSITDLADRLDRNYSDVHEDVQVMANYHIVFFDTDGRTKTACDPLQSSSRRYRGCR